MGSAEAELYAINTEAAESSHIKNILREAPNTKKSNVRIHTDSSRERKEHGNKGWVIKKQNTSNSNTFIQQLVQHDFVRIIKINAANNPADIFTK